MLQEAQRFSTLVIFTYSESLIEMAKVEALKFLGEDQAAFELNRKSLLRTMKGVVVKDSESAG